jgi:hypothetical protein
MCREFCEARPTSGQTSRTYAHVVEWNKKGPIDIADEIRDRVVR